MKTQNIDLSVPQIISTDVLLEKYCKDGETTTAEVFARVAKALASVEKESDAAKFEQEFLFAMNNGFVPAGRIMSAAGTSIKSTLLNCFVQPVGDSFSETCEVTGKPGIYTALAEAGETMRRGGGVGYDFSAIRPKGSLVKGTKSDASGPVSFMRVFNSSCATVVSAGGRRGAQMGVLRVDHPDIMEFCQAKRQLGELTNFNVSVGVTDEFMRAVEAESDFDLIHVAEPTELQKQNGARYDSERKVWIYSSVNAKALYDQVIRLTYDFAEPGVLYIDRMNEQNNLKGLGEVLESTNPCAEQPLPSYGCCCLGSVNLSQLVRDYFSVNASLDWGLLATVVQIAVRMLDNVLDLSFWPLEKQRAEAMAKRRIGLGFTGLGDALLMLGIKYDSEEGRQMAAQITEFMRDNAYRASVELAKEKGAFAIFKADGYLQSPFIQRLPKELQRDIKKFGIRNSHLLSIAPTGTLSLAFCDNTSNGIEPNFTWTYDRVKVMRDGSKQTYPVMSYGYRVYLANGGDPENLPAHFTTALSMSAYDHMAMLQAVQPFIDTSISKTVNVPEDYPFEEFKGLYLSAWKGGLKGLATYRPSDVRGAVLVAPTEKKAEVADLDQTDPDRRVKLDKLPEPALATLRWNKRPKLAGGNPSWTYMVSRPDGQDFAVMVGHVENGGAPQLLEVWVNGAEAPRGLGSLAKSLSMDMRSEDTAWLKAKLDSLSKVKGDGFMMPCPFDGEERFMPSSVAAMATIVKARCEQLGVFKDDGVSPVLDSLMSQREPKTGTDGTMAWAVDVKNPATGDDFCLFLKELQMPDGSRRPYSVWLSGEYPQALDGLLKSLSFDMRVIDPAWVGAKLRQLMDFAEVRGDFWGQTPGSKKSANQPSTVAYIAKLILHRFAMLGILDDSGFAVQNLGYFSDEAAEPKTESKPMIIKGKVCASCKVPAVIKKDGCDWCSACGEVGSCG